MRLIHNGVGIADMYSEEEYQQAIRTDTNQPTNNNMERDLFTWKTKKSRADQILDKFEEFHSRNPEVWTLFKRFTFEMINRGKSHYSVNAVTERIRWHSDIETTGEEVKIGNNFRAHYARLFHIAFPEHDGFFFTRKLVSEDAPALDDPDQPFHPQPPTDEVAIKTRLKSILETTP